MSAKSAVLSIAIISLFLLSGCAEIDLLSSCVSNADCQGGQFCVKGKCVSVSTYKPAETQKPATVAVEQKKPPVIEGFEICENEDPLFDPRWECQKIRMTKFADRSICDYTISSPTWYNMGACYDCIVSCK